MDGRDVGTLVGWSVGKRVGCFLGLSVGECVGMAEGDPVGRILGRLVLLVGTKVFTGDIDGPMVEGRFDG